MSRQPVFRFYNDQYYVALLLIWLYKIMCARVVEVNGSSSLQNSRDIHLLLDTNHVEFSL